MSNQDNRVLSRMGAREITEQELEHIYGAAGGGPPHTNVCTLAPSTEPSGFTVQCDIEH